MALIKCPECGHDVSTNAAACPQCGSPISETPKRVSTTEDSLLTRNRGCGDLVIYGPIIFIILIVLLMVLGRSGR
ncbi:MAG TPA: zinc-ribbon domain-containing protein [Planctomycetota bacterium]